MLRFSMNVRLDMVLLTDPQPLWFASGGHYTYIYIYIYPINSIKQRSFQPIGYSTPRDYPIDINRLPRRYPLYRIDIHSLQFTQCHRFPKFGGSPTCAPTCARARPAQPSSRRNITKLNGGKASCAAQSISSSGLRALKMEEVWESTRKKWEVGDSIDETICKWTSAFSLPDQVESHRIPLQSVSN